MLTRVGSGRSSTGSWWGGGEGEGAPVKDSSGGRRPETRPLIPAASGAVCGNNNYTIHNYNSYNLISADLISEGVIKSSGNFNSQPDNSPSSP